MADHSSTTAGASPPKSHKQAGAHGHGPGRYFVVWIALLVFTFTTFKTGHMDLGWVNLPLALTIACIKASLVVLFFMHLSEATGANRIVFVVSILFLLVMLLGVFGDLLTRNAMSLPGAQATVPEQALPDERR